MFNPFNNFLVATEGGGSSSGGGEVYEYRIIKNEIAEESAAGTYRLTKFNSLGEEIELLDSELINIPKDMFIESGEVKECIEDDNPIEGLVVGGKYIDIKLANSDDEHLYINVSDLIDKHDVGKSCENAFWNDYEEWYEGYKSDEIFNDYENNKAVGKYSHAEGSKTTAQGLYAHAEGYQTRAGMYEKEAAHAEGYKTTAYGDSSHSEGYNTIAQVDAFASHTEGYESGTQGKYSHAEGYRTIAWGNSSHSEGESSSGLKQKTFILNASSSDMEKSWNSSKFGMAFGVGSHIEGKNNLALGAYSHAEGENNKTSKNCSHAEGSNNSSTGAYSHVEGSHNSVRGESSHAEGYNTLASGDYSHSEGSSTEALDNTSHAEGSGTTAYGASSHSEGKSTNLASSKITITSSTTNDEIITKWNANKFSYAKGEASHVEGRDNLALTNYSHAEGYQNIASGNYAHTEGWKTLASGSYSHAEGTSTIASGRVGSHAEGGNTVASGPYAHAEGVNTVASGPQAPHAEGQFTTAAGPISHAEGGNTTASGPYAHSQGFSTNKILDVIDYNKENDAIISAWNSKKFSLAKGEASHIEGKDSLALGKYSHAEGQSTIAGSDHQHVQGKYNVADNDSKYAFIIGNGEEVKDTETNTVSYNHSNAFAIDWDGKLYINNSEEGVDVADLSARVATLETQSGTEVATNSDIDAIFEEDENS